MEASRLLIRNAWAVVLFLVAAAAASSFRLVVLPDTQMYSQSYPDVFASQTRWVADHAQEMQIAFVSHLGDLVNSNTPQQWTNADAAMDTLDGVVPYSAAIGNHDYDVFHVGGTSSYLAHFGPQRYEGRTWYAGADESGLNHYQRFTAAGRQFLHLTLEYQAPDDSLAWASAILRDHPHVPTIISTHDYLRDPVASWPGERSEAGQRIFEGLVQDHPQVFMVLAGHAHYGANGADGQWRQVSMNRLGLPVFEMLSNYQDWPSTGGEGYLRLITFDDEADLLKVETYSPWLQRYLVSGEGPTASAFEYELDLETRFSGLPEPSAALTLMAAAWMLAGRRGLRR